MMYAEYCWRSEWKIQNVYITRSMWEDGICILTPHQRHRIRTQDFLLDGQPKK